MEKVYISGPITGYDLEERRAAFARAADAEGERDSRL